MSSLNDHNAWAGNIEDVIAMSIHESDTSVVDLMRDNDEAGPNDTVKVDPADPRGKHDIVHNEDDNFYQYYDRGEGGVFFMFKFGWISFKSLQYISNFNESKSFWSNLYFSNLSLGVTIENRCVKNGN
jgi:hypothetical protein